MATPNRLAMQLRARREAFVATGVASVYQLVTWASQFRTLNRNGHYLLLPRMALTSRGQKALAHPTTCSGFKSLSGCGVATPSRDMAVAMWHFISRRLLKQQNAESIGLAAGNDPTYQSASWRFLRADRCARLGSVNLNTHALILSANDLDQRLATHGPAIIHDDARESFASCG